MKTTFTARHFEASTDLQNFCRDSVEKLEQFYDRIVMCDIILQPTPSDDNPQQAELIVKVPRKILTAKESGTTYEQAMHNAIDVITRQLKRYKQKMHATN
ncbi:ribosome hibernation-promoting factor, HPF/YfiA family [Gracilimonas mengyeensis]|uniref:Putative sigma-54 modulation protein n=1 Tax=Gracilimonas mengyeensis TaxID=1302730 RepID=A0A521AWH7_9BACT|nr:ribosome-associated translation inhibitor RaiA [Gracilimonas mengyeensis]SMO39144.1 putative sigma-54 modulation protein [Gracilimonas mengyeensis]